MKTAFSVAALSILVSTSAFAANECSKAPASKFQPKTTLEDQLKAQGLTVRQIKTESGCYEVYAIDKNGKKINEAFNAETLKKVGNAEAGEN
jgi:hypothetical protein